VSVFSTQRLLPRLFLFGIEKQNNPKSMAIIAGELLLAGKAIIIVFSDLSPR
jgi:hypothetical protein